MHIYVKNYPATCLAENLFFVCNCKSRLSITRYMQFKTLIIDIISCHLMLTFHNLQTHEVFNL